MRHFEQAVSDLNTDSRPWGNVNAIHEAVQKMRAASGNGGRQIGHDRIVEALTALRRDGPEAALPKNCRHICWGLITEVNQWCLLADQDLFPRTMNVIRSMEKQGAFRTAAWRALLHGYLSASSSLVGRAKNNWSNLRSFLEDSRPRLQARRNPEWMDLIHATPALLGDQPCAPFAQDVLSGNTTQLDQMNRILVIDDKSWFWEHLLLSQVELANHFADDKFISVLDNILIAVSCKPAILNDALKALLTRHSSHGLIDKPHENLKRISVEKWGSPNLSTQPSWNIVEPAVKSMVQQWLVLEDLVDFCKLIGDGDQVDGRRLNFWLKYLKSISFAKIAFGYNTLRDAQRNASDFLKKREGRYGRLINDDDNNALILKIGSYVFIEFSKTGNACYGYADDNLPFNINATSLAAPSMKRRNDNIFRESHMSSWEWKFESRLKALGIYPDNHIKPASQTPFSTNPSSRTTGQPTNRAPTSIPVSQGQPQAPTDWERSLAELKRKFMLRGEDNRLAGGAIWVRHMEEHDVVAPYLRELGFRFAPGRGWWRK